jgi:hypothetical protein
MGAAKSATATISRDGTDLVGPDVENLQFANVPTFRFFHTQAGGHLFTTSAVEAASVRANLPVYRDEGTTFLTADEGFAGAVPVFRFFHTQAGGHLFTTSAVEAASVRANLPVYRDEGIAFSMSATAGEGLAPIFASFTPRRADTCSPRPRWKPPACAPICPSTATRASPSTPRHASPTNSSARTWWRLTCAWV